MQRAKAQHQIHRVNAHHGPVLEQLAQDAERNAVIWIVECRNDHARVADVEIRIACRQPIAVVNQRRRHRQRNDLRFRAIFKAQLLDALPVFGKRFVIDVPLV